MAEPRAYPSEVCLLVRAVVTAACLAAGADRLWAQEPAFGPFPAWSGPGSSTQSVALGDVDGDGDLDLVLGNYNQGTTLYLNNGKVFAAAPAWTGPQEATACVALGDVDGDGDLDLVCGNERTVTLYLNTGGVFAPAPTWTAPGGTSSLALGDVDGDGDLDLVCGGNATSATLHLNSGGAFAQAPAWTGPAEATLSVALGDVDGDGDLDLVRGNYREGSTLYLNSGGAFGSAPAWTGPAEATRSVALGDVDHDGHLDLVLGNEYLGSTLHLNTGGAFASSPAWTGPWSLTLGMTLGDVNGDGYLDVVLGNYTQGTALFINVGSGFASEAAWTGPPQQTLSVALGDVDGDGDLDLMSGNVNQGSTLYLNNAPTFTPYAMWFFPREATRSVALGDVDGDGNLDLVRGNENEATTLYLNSDVDFATVPAWSGPASATQSVALGDVDGDGDLDLVCGNVGQGNTLYLNLGGVFAPAPAWTGPVENTFGVALGDVDGDGDLDLVCGNYNQGATLYLNLGGVFAPTPAWTGPAGFTTSVALGDVDGDGDLDLVLGNFGQGSTLYLNIGGVFAPAPAWTGLAETTYSVALGDVDGDGDFDLVCGNFGQVATLYRNLGGVFAVAPAWTGLVENTHSVALGDVDGDGDLDLVRGNRNGPVTLYLNSGGALASVPTWSGPREFTRSVALGDVDGDGDVELVRGNDEQDISTLYSRQTPWRSGFTNLPNNPAYLRWVVVAPAGVNRYRISFRTFDAESDSLWLLGEYQREGSPTWEPMILNDSTLRIGPFTASPSGIAHEAVWDVSRLSFDRRNVVVRLRAILPPRRAGNVQFIPTYLVNAGRVTPRRAVLTVRPGVALDLGTLTVGDTSSAAVTIRNGGNENLVVSELHATAPEAAFDLAGRVLPFVLAPGESLAFGVTFAPVSTPSSPGEIQIRSNDPVTPDRSLALTADVRALQVRTRLPAPAGELPLGEAATVLVIPWPQVHVERGFVYHRPRGALAFADSVALGPSESDFVAIIPGDRITEAGLEYYVRVWNSGVSATDPAGSPEAGVFYQEVAAATQISPFFPADGFETGLPATLGIDMPSGSRFVSGTLFYRPGGSSAAYDSVELSSDDLHPGPIGVVPAEAVGPRGLECRIHVTTIRGAIDHPPATLDYPGGFFTVRTNVLKLVETSSHPGERYRMITVPLELNLPMASSLEALLSDQLGPYDRTQWRSYRFVPGRGAYSEISPETIVDGELRPEPGRAFWLVTRSPHRIDTAPVAGRSMPTHASYRLTLEPGWSQVGNPFLFPIAWQDVGFDPVAPEPPVAWDAALGLYQDADVDTLLPFEGYWIRNPSSAPVELSFDPHFEPAPGAAAIAERAGAEDSLEWQIRIEATRGEDHDRRNFAGVAAGALEERDPFDRSDPPLIPGSGLSLYFPDAASRDARRTVDVRPPLAAGAERRERGRRWAFDVAVAADDPSPSEVALNFTGLDRVPADVEVRVVDRRLRREFDPRHEPGYTYVAGRTGFVAQASEARFELLAGTAEYVDDARAGLASTPRLTRLLPTFPNPVSTSAAIRFETARPGRVTLNLYDVAGRRARTLVDEHLDAGLHELAWNGADEKGRSLAPGIYSLRLIAPDRVDAGKLVKIR